MLARVLVRRQDGPGSARRGSCAGHISGAQVRRRLLRAIQDFPAPAVWAAAWALFLNQARAEDFMTPLAIEAQRRLEEHRAALQRLLAAAGEGPGEVALELAETQAALDRIARGKYGRCESCNGALGRQRLLALPAARYCIGCAAPAGR